MEIHGNSQTDIDIPVEISDDFPMNRHVTTEIKNLDEIKLLDIRKILKEIKRSTSLIDVENILKTNDQVISNICTRLKNAVSNQNTENTSVEEKVPNKKRRRVIKPQFPKEILDNFEIINVESDGNCLFRAIAQLLFEDQHKYLIIKLFVINYVFMNRDRYAILCREGTIEVRKGNRDKDVILDPNIIDFFKMVAADKIWGNEGSILAVSNGLGIRILVYSIIGLTSSLAMIADCKPQKILSSRILTIFHMDCVHFYAAYPKDLNIIKTIEHVDKGIWKNVPYYPLSANI